ncbi:MAG: hypothetical protein JNM07_04465 [Phycisphaerae bacterium]|nr:hypothetical protein [Phycisphaerae bacterium]
MRPGRVGSGRAGWWAVVAAGAVCASVDGGAGSRAGAAWGQPATGASASDGTRDGPTPPPSREVDFALDSGLVANLGEDAAGGAVVFSAEVRVDGAAWLRLVFRDVLLSGDPAAENASFLRITSLRDGGVQVLNAERMEQWRNASAYFNGDAVRVEVVAFPGTGPCLVVMDRLTAGGEPVADRSICGATDDRALLNDTRSARHMPVGCTAWLFNDLNTMFLTAGHCAPAAGHTVQFNVPLSTSGGSTVNPPPEDQYPVDGVSAQALSGGVGNDYSYFGVNVNSNTGLTPYQAYGTRHTRAAAAPASGTQPIRITGYGTVSSPVSPTWNQVGKTHTGPYRGLSGTNVRYETDTTGGNSGSCVLDDSTGLAIGIHTHAGCSTTPGSYNNGTAIQLAGLQAFLANPLGVCRSGKGTPGGTLFVAGDAVNNVGTLSVSTGNFAKVTEVGATLQGLAWNWNTSRFFLIDSQRRLSTLTTSGVRTLLGTVTGTSSIINGLGFDPRGAGSLYGIVQSSGQLLRINTSTLAATAIGAASGGTVGALEFDTDAKVLYGIDDTGGSTLVRFNTATGAKTVVGALGAGITDCNGLAYNAADKRLYTINASTEALLRIVPSTGAASVAGGTGGFFGSSYGMACANPKPACPGDFNGDTSVDDFDLFDFLNAFNANQGAADFNGDTSVDDFDLFDFLNAFGTPC